MICEASRKVTYLVQLWNLSNKIIHAFIWILLRVSILILSFVWWHFAIMYLMNVREVLLTSFFFCYTTWHRNELLDFQCDIEQEIEWRIFLHHNIDQVWDERKEIKGSEKKCFESFFAGSRKTVEKDSYCEFIDKENFSKNVFQPKNFYTQWNV